ncbi:MAG: helix-turn-helix transcriptional regulator [Balneolales bacterium]|nr:helix-turn-helix transcriptional regulator [Balneolales bacterium]
MDIKAKIGNKIRKLRNQRNLSQEQFANLCGLDRTYLAGIEQGKRNVSIVNLEKLATAFEISLSELFEDL